MNRQALPASLSAIPVPRVPAWAVPRGSVDSDVEAAYMAGSALNSLDNLVRSDAPWLGAWRHRLALKAAAATTKLMRRTEDESALRDAWYLRQPGDAFGPAGNVLLAWRKLAGRILPPTPEDLQSVAELLGITWSDAFGDCLEELAADMRAAAPAPLIAARAATAIMRVNPKAEPLAWWMADCALSWRMGWRHAVPILGTQIHAPLLRFGPNRYRARPGGEEFERAVFVAASLGSNEACRLAAGMAQQADRLIVVMPKLRAKGAGEVIALLLSDDAVSSSFTSKAMTRWASRRLFERLQQLDAVRELSGRPTFRLYGL
ncbi:DUF1403 family protein [Aquamicrobium defluvii]|uniref:DUF1403 family protein n=1 Tax=Aquamicrobium defluvii TaxID=69279 RepID=A0A011UPY2_9HYPH|nr:DUF1403 family protein [Aquamicrobium defluvii]EXL07918.1 hypothetical protein BG36_04890 [Aquamicrobium defluvii]EZQ14909.1 hypothetical protein CF98_13505 [Halopseudomonas bauzanensis]